MAAVNIFTGSSTLGHALVGVMVLWKRQTPVVLKVHKLFSSWIAEGEREFRH